MSPRKSKATKSAKTRTSRSENPLEGSVSGYRLSNEEIQDRIRERAYRLFEQRGSVHGFDIQDWSEAEDQVQRETQDF